MDQKWYRLFRISKDIGQGAFQLELLERWAIYNIFNKDLLIQSKEPQFKRQYMDLVLLPEIINEEEEYEIEEV